MSQEPKLPILTVTQWAKKYIGVFIFGAFIIVIIVAVYIGNRHSNKTTATNNTSSSNSNTSGSSSGKYYATSDPAMFSAEQLFSVIDGSRIAAGIVSLQEDASLDGAANLRTYQIQQNGTTAGSDSNSIFQRVSNAVPATTYADEIYQPVCDNATTNSTFASLVGNDAVYKTLNDPKYTVAGVGLQKSDPGKCNGYAVIELADIN